MKSVFTMAAMLLMVTAFSQNKSLPYYEIPPAPPGYSAGAVASRMLDGLGFRFYWATEGLRAEDLSFKPGAEARTSQETLEHICEISFLVVNATTHTVNKPNQDVKRSFADMRTVTLENLKKASDQLRKASDAEMKEMTVRFEDKGKLVQYPFWNLLNGPVADCLWHVGQVVSFRRSSVNPFTEKISLFSGKVMP